MNGVSLVVCCHNSMDKLPQTIKHINALSVSREIPWELIIVDNASTDKTFQIALDLTKNTSYDYRVVSENLLGLKNARIKGVAESKYEFISFIDDDNWICPQWVQLVYELMSSKADIGACGGASEPAFDSTPPIWFESVHESFAVGRQCNETGYVPDSRGYLWGGGLTVRRCAFNKLLDKGFDFLLCGREGNKLSSGEDTELCFALRLAGWKLWYEERLKFVHYMPADRLNLNYLNRLYWAFGHASMILDYYKYFLQSSSINNLELFEGFLSFAESSFENSTSYLKENYFKKASGSNPDNVDITSIYQEYELGKAVSYVSSFQKIRNYFDSINNLKQHRKDKPTLTFNKYTPPKISIVTPSFNQAQYLEECIDSILGQNYPNLEYIIMDGGSTDGSVEIIKKHEKHLAYWQSKPDGGQYRAINDGFRRSTGEIMAWLNSDDKYHPGALHQVALAFSAMPLVEWITGRPTAWDDRSKLVTVFDHVPSWSPERLLQHGKDDYYIQQESTYWRRSLWDRAGGRLEVRWQLAADFELWCRFFNYSQLVGVDALLGGFRYHKDQKTANLMDSYEQEVLRIIEDARSIAMPGLMPYQLVPTVSMDEIIKVTVPILSPDTFSYFSYSRRPHFSWFGRSAKNLFGSSVDPDNCDLKIYQDLLCYTFILDNIPKGSRILEIGGCDSRVLKAIKNDYECWNIDKLEGLGKGLTDVTVDGFRLVRAYMGEFCPELPEKYFDFVFSISALEHVAETDENLRNICQDIDRVMKPEAYSLHCFDVVAKHDTTWTNQLLHYMFSRYDTINHFVAFDQMRLDPSLYVMSEYAYNHGWEHDTLKSYQNFGRPLSYNILWQHPRIQPENILTALQHLVPELKSSIGHYCDDNRNIITDDEMDILRSASNDPLGFLQRLEGPLFTTNHIGKLVHKIMLSPIGKSIRNALPKFKPYCEKYFPQMMVDILSDGSVTTCCFDPFGANRFASIYEKQFIDIWSDDLSRIMHGDFYDYKRCLQCIGLEGWASMVNEPGKRENWLQWIHKTPNEIQIEITTSCNYACINCPSLAVRQQRPAYLDLNKTFNSLRSMLKKTNKLNLYNYGEPLLHKDFMEFIRNCRSESEELILEIASNGMLLNDDMSTALIKSRVNRLIISVHGGPGTENMLKYSCHGADYEKVLENIRRLIQLRRNHGVDLPKISLRAILFDWNDNDEDMDRLRSDAKALGLSATWGHYDTDNYHWILDSSGQFPSKRFYHGSTDLKELADSRETFSHGRFKVELEQDSFVKSQNNFGDIVVATSIAPNEIEKQRSAILTWIDAGFSVLSVNSATEINRLRSYFPEVTFIESTRDGREVMGRPLIFLDDVLAVLAATQSRICGIINSDIHLKAEPRFKEFVAREAKYSLIIGHRMDVQSLDLHEGEFYQDGFDFFFFDRFLAESIPKSEFCLGATWWDIFFPVAIQLKGVTVKQLLMPVAIHQSHENRWNIDEWHANGDRLLKLINRPDCELQAHTTLSEQLNSLCLPQDCYGLFRILMDTLMSASIKIDTY